MLVSEIMAGNPVTVEPLDSLRSAMEAMKAGGFRRVPVVEGNDLVGILTERDLRQHAGYEDSTRVNVAMSAPAVTLTPQDSIENAARLILERKIGGLPVVEADRVVGMITTTDLIRALLKLLEASQGSATS